MRDSTFTYHPSTRGVATPSVSFSERLADACRQISRSAVLRSDSQRQLVTDIARGRGIIRFERLAIISRTCTDPADATAIGDCFRGFALEGHPAVVVTPTEALRAEAQADGAERQAVFEYLANPCLATRHGVIEALRRAVETSEVAIDALHRGTAV